MLELKGVYTRYGPVEVLQNVNLKVNDGELVCLLGGNACGKTTTMKTILGIVKPYQGSVEFDGKPIHKWPAHQIVRAGISAVLEARRIFPYMTVEENLLIGAYARNDHQQIRKDIDEMYFRFPVLSKRRSQNGGSLSGGEQQMLAMARALLSKPRMLIMDEPSMGLSPLFSEKNFETIKSINNEGMSILLVEQNASMALSISHRGYVLQTGKIVLEDTAENLLKNPLMKKAYLGVMEPLALA